MNASNWSVVANTDCNDVPAAVGTTTFTVTAGLAGGTWRGDVDDDWFNCGNWEDLTVPDEDVDVTINSSFTITNSPDIDNTSANAAKFENIAECNDLLIDNDVLSINGSYLDSLYVYGDLSIQNTGSLDMQDGTGTDDGVLILSGDLNNTATFDAGEGTVILNGANAQSLNSSSGLTMFIK